MNIEAIRQLIADLTRAGLSGAEIEKPGFRLNLKRGPAPSAVTAALVAPASEPVANELIIKAPALGCFLEAHPDDGVVLAAPGSEVQVGQRVALLAVGALLLPVYSTVAGRVASQLVPGGSNVGYGQPLFSLSPTGVQQP